MLQQNQQRSQIRRRSDQQFHRADPVAADKNGAERPNPMVLRRNVWYRLENF